jgi:tetratricopeptide (TPR) repeat protein
LEQYKLAQTIDPDEPVIIDEINRLEKKLNDLAETHYQAGIRFRDKGKWDLAKKEFLKALRYRPDHKKAAAMLQQRRMEGTRAFITHEIAPGESISKLALKYYGDYKKYHHIANFNNMSDAAQVRVGQRVMVPVIDGVTIEDLNRISTGLSAQPPAVTQKAPESQPVAAPPAAPVDSAETPPPEAPEPVDQVTGYRQTGIALFNEKKYDEAIVELDKVLNAAPEDDDAIDYISRAYVETGRAYLAQNRIDEAKNALIAALDYDDNCRECQDLLAQCRAIEAKALTEEGETLFKNNQFDKAISTLERAAALNPEDATAAGLLFQTHFQKALILYNKQDYLAAKAGFEKAAALQSDCSECKRYIENSMAEYKDFHYNEGIVFFGQEALKKAISAWEKVAAVDPDYKDVQQNLKKATLLNDRLERIKQSTSQ